jgi:hypothetical protein
MALARISITIPRELLAEADGAARQLDRSRSWIVADAVRRYLRAGRTPPWPSLRSARWRPRPLTDSDPANTAAPS